MGESVVTNTVTYVNLSKKTSYQETYDEVLVPPRCFHAQCKYGEYLIISVSTKLFREESIEGISS
jgi:hypothetical protein